MKHYDTFKKKAVMRYSAIKKEGQDFTDDEIWDEMARRKLQFHRSENWDEIRLWGLFEWEDISHLLEEGLLVTDMKSENVTVWVRPSKEAWENYIKPLTSRYTLGELTDMAGWNDDENLEQEWFDI